VRFGFHVSISGGFSKVVERAVMRECETIQLFSRNPRGWRLTPLESNDVDVFRREIEQAGIFPVFVHMPYLPNLATSEPLLSSRSVEALSEDLTRAEALGSRFLILHVGSRKGIDQTEAIENVSKAINRGLSEIGNSVRILLENTAGMGSEVGSRFEEIGQMLERIEYPDRAGVCFDTAHAYEAGYDISTEEGLKIALAEFDQLVGLERIHVLHLNDSKTRLGSRVDRHWHIGEGLIGREGFRGIVNHPALRHLPAIMETPRIDAEDDIRNMRVARSLVMS